MPDKSANRRSYRAPLFSQVLVGCRHVHTLQLIFLRSFSHSSGLWRELFSWRILPFWRETAGRIGAVLRIKHTKQSRFAGPTPKRLEAACGCNSRGAFVSRDGR